jgi:chromosome transmission fidelity protein 1
VDIEEIAAQSKRMQICGYYSSRQAQEDADLLVLPYQSLLSETARSALGIDLTDKVVVFDEAHNLMETIQAMF